MVSTSFDRNESQCLFLETDKKEVHFCQLPSLDVIKVVSLTSCSDGLIRSGDLIQDNLGRHWVNDRYLILPSERAHQPCVLLWDSRNESYSQCCPHPSRVSINAIRVDSALQKVVTVCTDACLYMFDRTKEAQLRPRVDRPRRRNSFVLDSDERYIVYSGLRTIKEPGKDKRTDSLLVVYDTVKEDKVREFCMPTKRSWTVSKYNDSTVLIEHNRKGYLLDLIGATVTMETQGASGGTIDMIGVSANQQIVSISRSQRSLKLHDAVTGKASIALPDVFGSQPTQVISEMIVTPEGRYVIMCDENKNNKFVCYQLRRDEDDSGNTTDKVFDLKDGTRTDLSLYDAFATDDEELLVTLAEAKVGPKTGRLRSISCLTVWNLRTRVKERVLFDQEFADKAMGKLDDMDTLYFASLGGRFVVTGHDDGYVRVWHLEQSTPLTRQKAHDHMISDMFAPRCSLATDGVQSSGQTKNYAMYFVSVCDDDAEMSFKYWKLDVTETVADDGKGCWSVECTHMATYKMMDSFKQFLALQNGTSVLLLLNEYDTPQQLVLMDPNARAEIWGRPDGPEWFGPKKNQETPALLRKRRQQFPGKVALSGGPQQPQRLPNVVVTHLSRQPSDSNDFVVAFLTDQQLQSVGEPGLQSDSRRADGGGVVLAVEQRADLLQCAVSCRCHGRFDHGDSERPGERLRQPERAGEHGGEGGCHGDWDAAQSLAGSGNGQAVESGSDQLHQRGVAAVLRGCSRWACGRRNLQLQFFHHLRCLGSIAGDLLGGSAAAQHAGAGGHPTCRGSDGEVPQPSLHLPQLLGREAPRHLLRPGAAPPDEPPALAASHRHRRCLGNQLGGGDAVHDAELHADIVEAPASPDEGLVVATADQGAHGERERVEGDGASEGQGSQAVRHLLRQSARPDGLLQLLPGHRALNQPTAGLRCHQQTRRADDSARQGRSQLPQLTAERAGYSGLSWATQRSEGCGLRAEAPGRQGLKAAAAAHERKQQKIFAAEHSDEPCWTDGDSRKLQIDFVGEELSADRIHQVATDQLAEVHAETAEACSDEAAPDCSVQIVVLNEPANTVSASPAGKGQTINMSINRRNWRFRLSAALQEFARDTTAHGVARVAQAAAPVPQRLTWACLVLLAFGGFTWHLTQLTQRYLEYPVTTELLLSDGDNFEFPDVTVCPNDFIVRDNPLSITSRYTVKAFNRTIEDMIYDIPRLYHTLTSSDWNASVPLEAFAAYEDGKLALKSLAYRQPGLFQESHETVIYCRFNSGPCAYANFTYYKDEERFLCISLTPRNRTIVESGEGNGLYLLLYQYSKAFLTEEQQIESMPGFRVALHEPGTKPDFASQSFSAPLGYKTSVGLETSVERKLSRRTSPCCEKLPNATYTWDYSRPGDFENVTFFGTLQDCAVRAKQEEFAETCGCLGTHLALPADMLTVWPPCHQLPEEVFFRDLFVDANKYAYYYTIMNATGQMGPLTDYLMDNWPIYNATGSMLKCYRLVRHRQSTEVIWDLGSEIWDLDGVSTDHCRLPCSQRQNRLRQALASWPSANSAPTDNLAVVQGYLDRLIAQAEADGRSLVRIRELKNNLESRLTSRFCVIDLFVASMRVNTAVEDFAYPMRNLFSDLGGSLGLWIGVSIITLNGAGRAVPDSDAPDLLPVTVQTIRFGQPEETRTRDRQCRGKRSASTVLVAKNFRHLNWNLFGR
uniref:WD_REPEATS_REGION domain-containing protein n=1 Tax=Macrostomum lignano TaxID=282301 RepID=A0A1I8IC78_9PLAT